MIADIDVKKLYEESVAAAGGRDDPCKQDGYFITEYGAFFMVIGYQYYRFTPQGWKRVDERAQELWYSNLWIEHDDVTSFLDIPTAVSRRYHLNDYPIIDFSDKDKNQGDIVIDYFDRFRGKLRDFLTQVQSEESTLDSGQQFVRSWDAQHFDMERALSDIDSADESFIVSRNGRVIGLVSASLEQLSEGHSGEDKWSPARKMEIHYLAFARLNGSDDIGGMLLRKISTNYRFQRFDTVIHVAELTQELSAVLQSNRYDFLEEGVYGVIRHEPDLLNFAVRFTKAEQKNKLREKEHKSAAFRSFLLGGWRK